MNDGEQTPAIAQIWPDIPDVTVAVYARHEMAFRVGMLEGATIWTAIELFTQMYGLYDMLGEVLRNLATFLTRPDGDTALCGHE